MSAFRLLIIHFRCHGLGPFSRNISEPVQANVILWSSPSLALYFGPKKEHLVAPHPAISGEVIKKIAEPMDKSPISINCRHRGQDEPRWFGAVRRCLELGRGNFGWRRRILATHVVARRWLTLSLRFRTLTPQKLLSGHSR